MVRVVWLKESLGFHAVNPVRFYHADLHNLPYIQTPYKHTFDTTNQLATSIIYTKCDLHHGQYMCIASQQLCARST